MIYGHTFVNANLPDLDAPSSIIGYIVFCSVLYYINQKILGSDSRIEHYKKIFDSWDKWKRRRWRFYVTSIMISIYAVLMLVIEVDEDGLNPKNWSW
jgi:ABC-type spermidine/putrescine transport system permease subunit I